MNTKSLFTTLLLIGLFLTTTLAQSPIGVWKTIDDETGEARSHVEIYQKGNKLHGKLVKIINPTSDVCDTCSGDKKGQPYVGMEIMWDMKKSGDTWKSGTIYAPDKDKEYSCKIWLDGDNELKVRGYIALFYRTQTWHRIK